MRVLPRSSYRKSILRQLSSMQAVLRTTGGVKALDANDNDTAVPDRPEALNEDLDKTGPPSSSEAQERGEVEVKGLPVDSSSAQNSEKDALKSSELPLQEMADGDTDVSNAGPEHVPAAHGPMSTDRTSSEADIVGLVENKSYNAVIPDVSILHDPNELRHGSEEDSTEQDKSTSPATISTPYDHDIIGSILKSGIKAERARSTRAHVSEKPRPVDDVLKSSDSIEPAKGATEKHRASF